jgi:transcriptional regulator with AAA-type ATPase domain
MSTLIADRFLYRMHAFAVGGKTALDLATGDLVRLRVEPAGTRREQQAWSDACARAHAEGRLVDFGFIGSEKRFEASALKRVPLQRTCRAVGEGVLQWLEHMRPSSARIVYVSELPDARDLRLRGFVPCQVSLVEDGAAWDDIAMALADRSIVLLDPQAEPFRIAMAFLRLRQVTAREVCGVVTRKPSMRGHIASAAEDRAVYGRVTPTPDPRATQMMAEAERMLLCGKHAAAERALRSARGAFDRRGNTSRAGDAAITLGRLLLSRGRATDAKAAFEEAHDYYRRGGLPDRAIDATVYVGLVQTDLTLLGGAERTLRAAYSAAAALGKPDPVLLAGIGLARNLFWQERYGDARSILESITPAGNAALCARYWCLVARLRITANSLPDARQAVERARPGIAPTSPEIEALVRLWEATVQARLGDLEALNVHVTAGLAAARAAHLPLQVVRLKLAHVEGLVRTGRSSAARSAARHLLHIRQGAVPPLLRRRIESALKGLNGTAMAHETTSPFQADSLSSGVEELDGLRSLLALSHQPEDEADVLTRAATAIRRHTHAAGIGIFGAADGVTRLVGASGSASSSMAQRSINVGQPIVPERAGSWVEGAVPVQYLGRFIGAVAMRWSIEGPENTQRVIAFGAAAAAVCAPLLFVVIERQSAVPMQEAAFDLVGTSPAIQAVRKAIARAANAPFTVLIEGESGSGKELVARAIHRAGCRRDRRFCALNCAAMPEDLVDAELFGHAKGAFTGAAIERLGLFESADGGTVFLDEIAELSARAQAKVLRVLQEGEIRRIGEHVTRSFDARLVAATNRPLGGEVEAGRFRQDLLYRLDVIRINVPPLRDRLEDVPLLAARFWKQCAERMASKAVLGQSALAALARYDWPGNVRELQNVLTALVVAVPARGVVGASVLPAAIASAAQPASCESLESARLKFEQRFVRAALARSAGHRGKTAAALGLSRQGLAKLMQRLHLDV